MGLPEGTKQQKGSRTDTGATEVQLLISQALHPPPSLTISEPHAIKLDAELCSAPSFLLPLSLLLSPLQSCSQPCFPPDMALLRSQEKSGETSNNCS